MNTPYIIGISGGSGSGKTTIVQSLKEQFGDAVCFISQDDFYKPKKEQKKDKNGIVNFDLPSAIDAIKMHSTLDQLKQNQPVTIEEYTFNNASKKAKVIRRIKRDKLQRNYPLEDVLYRYEHHVLPAYRQHIYPYLSTSDIIIRNDTGFKEGIAPLVALIDNMLTK